MNISSGRFVLSEMQGLDALTSEIGRIQPAEILFQEELTEVEAALNHPAKRRRPVWEFELENANRILTEHFNTRDLVRLRLRRSERRPAGCRLPHSVCAGDTEIGPAPYSGHTGRASGRQRHPRRRQSPQPGAG